MMVTPLYAGLLGVWFLVLSVRVVQKRASGISLGDGGDPIMLRRIRGHANFTEYVPLCLLLIGVLELSRASVYVLHALGLMLLIGRLLHGWAFAFSEHFRFGRMWGTALTFLVLLLASLLCAWQGLRVLPLTF
ncbi:MAPEG family protein [Solimonas marina]|uniref:Glutathione metabolism protein n=1 Tax=Solimonas marina TaxID=2714601 RepID=A0A969WB86_9GAMM|nr:MAPEG family protein [Solimonas marina]NKF22291.1 hypothetical protein [Solimonas marina]